MSDIKKIILKIKEVLSSQVEERSKTIIEEMSLLLKQIPELEKYINENNHELKNAIFKELGRYINYKKFHSGKILKRICEGDNFFYMILTGEISKIGIKYKKVTITFKDFILHLSKLQLLEENFLLNDCIEKNYELFPFRAEKNIIKSFKKIQAFNFKNELQLIKSEINNSKWNISKNNIDDYLSLVNFSFLEGKINFLSKEMKFPVILPYYVKDEILNGNSFIGTLLKSKGIKEFYSYIFTKNSDVLYIDKSLIAPGSKLINIYENRLNYPLIENIIKKNLIFKNANIDYLIKNYSKYFSLIKVKKGERLISQGRPHEGVFFINKGVFQLKTQKSYIELQELIFSLRDSLDSFSNYISNIKNRENDDLNNKEKNIENKLFNHPMFLIKANEKKEITFATYHAPHIFGLNESFDNKTGIYHFSLYCISDDTEVYFLPNDIFSSLLSIDCINKNIATLIEEKVKSFLFRIKKFKYQFELAYERFISLSKYSKNHNADKIEKQNFKSCSNLLSRDSKSRKIINKSPFFNYNSNSTLYSNDNKIEIETNYNINKKIFCFSPLSTKEKTKNILNLNNNHNLTLVRINKNLNKIKQRDFHSPKSNSIKDEIEMKSPSTNNISRSLFKLSEKNESINDNCNNLYFRNIKLSKNNSSTLLSQRIINGRNLFKKLSPINQILYYKKINHFNKNKYNSMSNLNKNKFYKNDTNESNKGFCQNGNLKQIDRSLLCDKKNKILDFLQNKKNLNLKNDKINNNNNDFYKNKENLFYCINNIFNLRNKIIKDSQISKKEEIN